MEFKFQNKPEWKAIGTIWLISAISFFIAGHFRIMLNGINAVSLLHFLTAFLNVSLGVFYLRLSNINYLIIKNKTLTIRRGIIGKRTVKIEEIKRVQINKKNILLFLESGRRAKIRYKLLSDKDYSKLKQELEK